MGGSAAWRGVCGARRARGRSAVDGKVVGAEWRRGWCRAEKSSGGMPGARCQLAGSEAETVERSERYCAGVGGERDGRASAMGGQGGLGGEVWVCAAAGCLPCPWAGLKSRGGPELVLGRWCGAGGARL